MPTQRSTDPRLDEIQERIDTIRRRLPDNPGLVIDDPDSRPVTIVPDEPTGSP